MIPPQQPNAMDSVAQPARDAGERYKVSIIEDADSIRANLAGYLGEYYQVSDFATAEAFFEHYSGDAISPPHLVFADIRLPGMSGLDAVRRIHRQMKGTQTALMTAYDTNEFVHFCKIEGIKNVIPKTTALNLDELRIIAHKLLTKDIFGIHHYFPDIHTVSAAQERDNFKPQNKQILFKWVYTSRDLAATNKKICNWLVSQDDNSGLSFVLDELTSNAMTRAARLPDGRFKYQNLDKIRDIFVPDDNIVLDEADYFQVGFGRYDDWLILITIDPHGSLTREEILYRLDRHIPTGTTGLPNGLGDTHGRGIFIMREQVSQLIFNLWPHQKTEVICMARRREYPRFKGIYIYER